MYDLEIIMHSQDLIVYPLRNAGRSLGPDGKAERPIVVLSGLRFWSQPDQPHTHIHPSTHPSTHPLTHLTGDTTW